MEKIIRGLHRFISVFAGMILLFLGTSLAVIASGAVNDINFEWESFALSFEPATLPFMTILGWVAIGTGIALVGMLTIFVGFKRIKKTPRIVVSGADTNGMVGGGQVTVSTRSIEALTHYVAEKIPGVREVAPIIRIKKQGLFVDCRVVLTPDSSIPEVSTNLKNALKHSLEQHTGIPVSQVNIDAQLDAIDATRLVH